MKPLALDLCCGKGGWTIGLQATGWEVIGCDIEAWLGYPGDHFIQGDVRTLDLDAVRKIGKVQLVCASPPCQEFSKLHLPFFKKLKDKILKGEAPQPDKSIWEACVRIAAELEAPLILENVVGAQYWMGKGKWHGGPFYIWGDLPALMPQVKAKKGMNLDRYKFNGVRLDYLYQGPRKWSSKSPQRKEWSAKAAMIPLELATWIGECFMNSLK